MHLTHTPKYKTTASVLSEEQIALKGTQTVEAV